MYISRIAENKLLALLATPKVLIVAGARQVGKTTLLEHVTEGRGAVVLNLDLEVDKARLLAASQLTPLQAMQSLGSPSILIIDEAQRLPEVGRIAKGWYDARVETKLVLLGSSSINLLDASAEALTGRNEKIFLPPLVFAEILQAQPWFSRALPKETLIGAFANQLQSLLLNSLVFGGYPEAVTTSDKEQYLINLASDYLLKDIWQMATARSPETIRKLLLLLAHQVGSLVSVSELAQNLGVSRLTVEKYLELLERTFVIFRLPAFSGNLRKEISKSTKVYFWDTGVRNAMLKDFVISEYRADIGRLWENWVVAEFAKRNLLNGQRADLYFWRTTDGSEVDLVVKEGGSLRAYEVKWTRPRWPSVRAFISRYGVDVTMVTKDNFAEVLL